MKHRHRRSREAPEDSLRPGPWVWDTPQRKRRSGCSVCSGQPSRHGVMCQRAHNTVLCERGSWTPTHAGVHTLGAVCYRDTLMGILCVSVLGTQLCPNLCNPMDCSLPGSSVYEDSPGKNTGVGCHALLQGIFPTQRSKPGLLRCRQILHHLSTRGAPRNVLHLHKGNRREPRSTAEQPEGEGTHKPSCERGSFQLWLWNHTIFDKPGKQKK